MQQKTFNDKLKQLLHNKGKYEDLNIKLSDPLFTVAIDAILPTPIPNKNLDYRIDYLVIFDIEFHLVTSKNIRENLGFEPFEEKDTAPFIREFAFLVLERKYVSTIHYWEIATQYSIDIDSYYFMTVFSWLRTKTNNKTINVHLPDRKFMTVSNEFDTIIQSNKRDNFIKRLAELNNNIKINENNISSYARHDFYKNDPQLINYHDSALIAYHSDSDVKSRQVPADIMYTLLEHFTNSKSKICLLYKGSNDRKALNNTFRLLHLVKEFNYQTPTQSQSQSPQNGQFAKKVIFSQIPFNLKVEMKFPNVYDMVYLNGICHILFGNARLGENCKKILETRYFQTIQEIRGYTTGFQNLHEFVSNLQGRAHEPLYDTVCTLIVVLIVNMSTYISFNENYKDLREFHQVFANLLGGGVKKQTDKHRQSKHRQSKHRQSKHRQSKHRQSKRTYKQRTIKRNSKIIQK